MRARPWIIATLLGVGAAACNLILDNHNVDVLIPQDAQTVVVYRDAESPPKPPPVVPVGCSLPRAGGSFTSCSGAACPIGQLVSDGPFDRLHSIPGGAAVRGPTGAQLLEDPGTGAKPKASTFGFAVGIDVVADYSYFYSTSVLEDRYYITRFRRDDGAPAGQFDVVEDFIQGRDQSEPALAMGGLARVLGVNRRSVGGFTLLHFLIDLNQDPPATSVVDVANTVNSDPGSVHSVYGALALGRVRIATESPTGSGLYDAPDELQVGHRAPPRYDLQDWHTVAKDTTPVGDKYVRRYANPTVVSGCEEVVVMTTLWHASPDLYSVAVEVDADAGLDASSSRYASTSSSNLLADWSGKYVGGDVYFVGERDERYVYFAPTRRSDPTDGGLPTNLNDDQAIYVFDVNDLSLVATLPTESRVKEIAVSDCWLYWLDGVGALHQMAKPGCHGGG